MSWKTAPWMQANRLLQGAVSFTAEGSRDQPQIAHLPVAQIFGNGGEEESRERDEEIEADEEVEELAVAA